MLAMTAAKDWMTEAEGALRGSPVRVLRDVPLRTRTSLGVGGPARLFLAPERAEDLAQAMQRLFQAGVAFDFLGAGSNLLVSDEGPSFVVISSEALAGEPRIEKEIVRVGAGYPVPRLVKRTAAAGLSGIEFAEGIPGSVGGCVRMNAGWHEGMFGQAVHSFTAISRLGVIEEVSATPETFAYRRCPGLGDRFVAAATLRLVPDDPARVRDRMQAYHDHRVATQPTGARNAGCIFKNPQGEHAGRLIDRSGLKGLAVGRAIVSDTHANFIINLGGATFADVRALIDKVRDEVHRKTGIALETEVVVWR
jgi:UDP-N-acetylenolpyruvoylglucosamine reductase